MTAPVSGRPEFDPRTGAGGFGRRHDADIDESCYLMPQAAHPASRRQRPRRSRDAATTRLDRGDLDAFCAELRGKGVSFKIASTLATNPAQKASGQAEEVLPSAATHPTAEAAASPFMTEPLEPHRADFAA